MKSNANQPTTYGKTEVDNSLLLKANQATTYTKTEVDNTITPRDNRVTKIERVVTVDPNNVYNYLETSTAALVIRTPNGISASFLGSMNGSEEGKALFYHDVEAPGNLILGGSLIQTQLEAKQAKVANVSDTEIGFVDGVTSSLQTQSSTKLGYDSNFSATAKIINLQGLKWVYVQDICKSTDRVCKSIIYRYYKYVG